MLHKAAIGVYDLRGVDAFWKFSAALFDAATDFYDANTYDKSRSKIYEELAALAAKRGGFRGGPVGEARARSRNRRAEHGQR